jgi:hypothetical protein
MVLVSCLLLKAPTIPALHVGRLTMAPLFLSLVSLIAPPARIQSYQNVCLVILTLSEFGGPGQIFIDPGKPITPPRADEVSKTLTNPST